MVGILLKIGKQSENVGEEEVFGRFCIRDITENPSRGLLRRADFRPPEIRFCPHPDDSSGGRISAGYPPSRNRVLPPELLELIVPVFTFS